eukprot:1177087-Prorocentrum_minimum.AAC.1
MTSFYGSSCANNGKGALNTPATLYIPVNLAPTEAAALAQRIDTNAIGAQYRYKECRNGDAFGSVIARRRQSEASTYSGRLLAP